MSASNRDDIVDFNQLTKMDTISEKKGFTISTTGKIFLGLTGKL